MGLEDVRDARVVQRGLRRGRRLREQNRRVDRPRQVQADARRLTVRASERARTFAVLELQNLLTSSVVLAVAVESLAVRSTEADRTRATVARVFLDTGGAVSAGFGGTRAGVGVAFPEVWSSPDAGRVLTVA